MPWLQIKIPTRPVDTEALEDALLIAGCQAVTLLDTADKPVFEPIRGTTPLWEHTTVQGLFEDDVDPKTLVATMKRLANDSQLTVGTITTEILEDKDWEREWMDNFNPIQCGDRLWIIPSWLEAPAPSAVNLKLDPGLAFGTGTHPTTYLCLKWMDKHIKVGDQILDFGCGSGILGLAGILLGAEHMDGIDIDPQALTATQNNAETNAIDNDKFQVTTKTEDLADEYDTVIANILAGTLVDLSSVILSKLKSKGHLVLSGILSHQAETVLEAYRDQIVFQPMSEKEGWVCLSGQKK